MTTRRCSHDPARDRRRGRHARADRGRARDRRGDGRDQARVARTPDLSSAPRRQGWQGVRPAQAAHDGRRRRARGRGPGDQRERPPGHASGRLLAPDFAGRAAQPAGRGARRAVVHRSAPDDPGAGGPVHRAPARPACDQARHHRLGPGQRSRLAALERAHRARPLLHRAPLAWRSTCVSCGAPWRSCSAARASTRARREDGRR